MDDLQNGPINRLRTSVEMLRLEESNYHGAIQALFVRLPEDHPVGPTTREVIEMIERKFGLTNAVTGQLTTIETTEMLVAGLLAAQEHLRPDTIDWYNQRIAYLLDCAARRVRPELV